MECANCLESPLQPAHMAAAEALYKLERGIRPVVIGKKAVATKSTSKGNLSTAFLCLAISCVLLVHFSGVLKTHVSGRVVDSDGVMACDLCFYSSTGMISNCSTNAAGLFSTKLYAGTYKVVIEKRPGLPKAYQSISTTPLRIKTEKGVVLKVVN